LKEIRINPKRDVACPVGKTKMLCPEGIFMLVKGYVFVHWQEEESK